MLEEYIQYLSTSLAERGCFEAVSGLLAPTKAGKEVLEHRETFRGHLGIVLILQLHAG